MLLPLDLSLMYIIGVPVMMYYITAPIVLAAAWLGWSRGDALFTVWVFSILVVIFIIGIMYGLDFELRERNMGSGVMVFMGLPYYLPYMALGYVLIGFTLGNLTSRFLFRLVRAPRP